MNLPKIARNTVAAAAFAVAGIAGFANAQILDTPATHAVITASNVPKCACWMCCTASAATAAARSPAATPPIRRPRWYTNNMVVVSAAAARARPTSVM